MISKCVGCDSPATRKNALGEPCCEECGDLYDGVDEMLKTIFEPPEPRTFGFKVAPELQALGFPSDRVEVISCCLYHANEAVEKMFLEMFGLEAMERAEASAHNRLEAQRHAHLN